MKAGLFVEHTTRPAARTSSFNGNFSFNTDAQNPRNTNVGFANALLGAITEYTESDGHPSAHGQFLITEWYAQDTWRVKRNLTLDAGVRFYYMTPTQSDGDQVAAFEPSEWSGAQAPRLYQPVTTAQGRRALNPLTGEILPPVYIGRLVPGSGNFINGMQVYDGTPQDSSPFRVAPRLVRLGRHRRRQDRHPRRRRRLLRSLQRRLHPRSDRAAAGAQHLPDQLHDHQRAAGQPVDARRRPPRGGSTRSRRPSSTTGALACSATSASTSSPTPPTSAMPGATSQLTVDINGRPYGYAYQPSSLDPTNVAGGQAQPLPDDFLRPYQGFGRIQQREFAGYSDYHALQFSVNRRRSSDGLSVGAAYTYQISTRTSARSIRSSRTIAPGTTRRTGGGRTCSCSTTRTRCRT